MLPDPSTSRADVVILGGGLAGLSAAWRLKQRKIDRIVVLEREDRPGGLLKTNRGPFYTIDNLPHVFFTNEPEATSAFEQLVGPVHRHEHRLGVLWKGGYVDFPFQDYVHQLSLGDRRRILVSLLEGRVAPAVAPENLEEFAIKVLGRGLVDLFFRPYNEKLWLTPLVELDYRWLGAKIRLPSPADMADSILGTGPARSDWAPHARFIYPQRGGIETLVDGLVHAVGPDTLRCRTSVRQVDTARHRVVTDQGVVEYDHLISTLPLDRAAQTFDLADCVAAMPLLRSTRVACVQLVLRDVTLPDFHWIYVPEKEIPFYRLTRLDRINPDASPGNQVLLVEWALNADAPVDADRIIAETTRHLEALGITAPGAILHHDLASFCPAYVVLDCAHETNTAQVLSALAARDVVSTGRFGEWRLLNMDHTMLSGFKAAERVLGSCSLS